MERKNREAWLQEGLLVLTEIGEVGLTIDILASRLNVTKGSFYHHFKNRQAFSAELLSFWERQMTMDIIAASEQGGDDFQNKNDALMKLAHMEHHSDLEVAIRAWALRDPQVKSFQERVDTLRKKYLQHLFGLLTDNKKASESMALMRYCIYIGAQQIIPRVPVKTLKHLLKKLNDMFEQHLYPDIKRGKK